MAAAMDQLKAQEKLTAMFIADWPSLKDSERKKIGNGIMKAANGSSREKGTQLSNAQLAEILKKR